MIHVQISDETFARLQRLAVPLVDSVDGVIVRLLASYEAKLQHSDAAGVDGIPMTATDKRQENASEAFVPIGNFRQPQSSNELIGLRTGPFRLRTRP